MPAWPVKLRVSPLRNPLVIDTVALVRFADEESVTLRVPSRRTGEPPPLKVTLAPAVTTGGRWTVALLLPALLARCPSLADQEKVRLVLAVEVVAKATESSACW